MKNLFLLLITLSAFGQQQDTLRRPVVAFTPLARDISHVSGLALGVGNSWNKPVHRQVINGLNLDVNPLGLILLIAHGKDEDTLERYFKTNNDSVMLVQNGVHLSIAGLLGNVEQNGLGIALFNEGRNANGLTVSFLENQTKRQNGLHITGYLNYACESNGVMVSLMWNKALLMRGLQVGLANRADAAYGMQAGVVNMPYSLTGLQVGLFNMLHAVTGVSIGLVNIACNQIKGVQIGLVNVSKKCRGLQIGLWNVNEKRMLPIINW
jgi:hypothetical protein